MDLIDNLIFEILVDFLNFFILFQIPINSDKKFAPIAKTGQCGGTA